MLIVADDLSGAAETAGAVVAATGLRVPLHLGGFMPRWNGVMAVDTDSRGIDGAAAAERVLELARAVEPETLIYKKVDSLLRGNVAAEVAALWEAGRAPVVAVATPRVGRTVLDGVVQVAGVPMHRTVSWGFERAAPPSSVAEALGQPVVVLPLPIVRSPGLAEAMLGALRSGAVPVCDSEVQADLDAVATAVLALPAPAAVVASGGLARSITPLLGLPPRAPIELEPPSRVLVLVGTRAASAAAQVVALAAEGIRHIVLRPGERVSAGDADTVLTLADEAWDERSLRAAVGDIVDSIRTRAGRTGLVLTGGSTARAVLDAMGVDRLLVEAEIEDGAVRSSTEDGVSVVTRPGAFGGADSLLRIVHHLRGRDQP